MADITRRNEGHVDDSGKTNWRGDQVSAPQGGQSIYKTSTIQLAQLGSRKVVGDRVFRYAKCSKVATAGKIQQSKASELKETIAGTVGTKGDMTFVYSAANTIGANSYAEGYLLCNSGAAGTGGNVYRIKSHGNISSAGTGTLYLYDPLAVAVTASAEYSIVENAYKAVQDSTTGAAEVALGVAPIAATTNDYFWLQTWGPAAIRCQALSKGEYTCLDDTGGLAINSLASASLGAQAIGVAMQAISAEEYGLIFVQIAP